MKTYVMFTCCLPLLLLAGCGSSNSNSSPDLGDIIISDDNATAPAQFNQFSHILFASKLQRSDPTQTDGKHSEVAKNSDLINGYYDNYFYADSESQQLVFRMSGYKNRSELRVNENFIITEQGIARTLSASFQPIGIKQALQHASSGDEVTFLQVHNKGTTATGDGVIPHPLVRITYELERNGQYGHYWAALKLNAFDCSSGSEYYGSADCDNPYLHLDLGEADLSSMTDMQITIAESRLIITVNGEQKVDYDISYWDQMYSYFKAGVYNQYDDGSGIKQWSEVRFSHLNVTESK